MIGGPGADTLFGGEGVDTLSYAKAAAAVSVNLMTGAASGGDAQGDVFSGFENLIGGAGDDTLIGDALANRILGGAGDDLIAGGGGDDLLRGDAGDDVFWFRGGEARGRIVIADFDRAGDDRVWLDGLPGFASFADVAPRLRQTGANVTLDLGESGTIVFRHAQPADFDASDFLFAWV